MTARLVRLGRQRLTAVPWDPEPPACNLLTRGGAWCIRNEHHRGGCLPLPANYPPVCNEPAVRPRKTDGGPSLREFLASKGEI